MEHTIMSRYRTTMKELLEKVYKEDGHQDVSSSKRMCKTIVEDAQQIESKLNSMSPEDSLDTWWTNKLAVSANNLNKARDYIVNDVKEELELDEGKMKTIATMFDQGQSAKEIAKKLKLPLSTVKAILGEGINPYISMQRDKKTGKMNYVVLDKDEKEAFSSLNYILAKDYLKKNYNKLKEEVILEFSDSMLDKLEREYAPLKGKSISIQRANQLRKIFDRVPDRALDALRRRKIPFLSGLALSRMIKKGMPVKEELEETPQGFALVQKAKEIAKKMAGNYTKAVKEIEKLQKGLSNNSSVKDALMKANESLEEKIQPFMISYSKNGQHAGFEGGNSLSDIQNKAQKLRAKGFTIDKMGRYSPPVGDMFMKKFARKEEYIKEEEMPKEEPKKDNEKKEAQNKDNTIAALKDQIAMLKTKLENEKNKAVKPEPNPDTGEVPLTVGVAYKHFKDKKEKEVKEETLEEMSPAEKKKRLQRAKDMIKYYDMMKKRALKGPNKALAKKMLKSELEEATVVSDISGISIPALKRETAKFNIKVARVTPGGPMGAEYEVTFTGAEKDLIAYAKEHFGFDDKPGTFQQLKKHLNMDYVPENDINEARYLVDVDVQFNASREENIKLVIDSSSNREIDIEDKADDKILQLMKQGKFGPRGARRSSIEIVNFERTSKPLSYYRASAIMGEADLTKKQIKMVHKVADDLPKKDFKDRYGKEKGDAVRFGTATNMVKKKLGMKEDRRLYVETIAGLKKKAEKSGMPYSILKKVYDRGMAAWKSGHRPGASQQQWAFARVNSFVTKSSGTWGGADKDLAKQVRGSK